MNFTLANKIVFLPVHLPILEKHAVLPAMKLAAYTNPRARICLKLKPKPLVARARMAVLAAIASVVSNTASYASTCGVGTACPKK